MLLLADLPLLVLYRWHRPQLCGDGFHLFNRYAHACSFVKKYVFILASFFVLRKL